MIYYKMTTRFCEYDYSNFPMVHVSFHGSIKNEDDFNLFTSQWLQLYEDQNYFSFIFDMEDMGLVNPYWSYKMASFITELKKQPIQYLQNSRIINVNKFTKYLLKIIFSVQSPVAPVLIVNKDGSQNLITP